MYVSSAHGVCTFKAVVLILHLPLDSTTVRPLFRSPGPRLGSAYGCEFGSSLGHSPPHQPGVVLGSPLVCVASLWIELD